MSAFLDLAASAWQHAERLVDLGVTVRLVIRGPSPGGLTPEEIAQAVGGPLLTAMRPEPYLPQALDRGDFAPRQKGPLARAARAALDELSAQPPRQSRSMRAAS